jgi:hypothetical protein
MVLIVALGIVISSVWMHVLTKQRERESQLAVAANQ